eukprot:CAMPEP_0115850428 /NCGR_PEP_ID=MMETSP0287-20121206/11959_1 /TAXON_ID=412157 /ORGANISM="Chrysochromulina rotalis, Strain UIO044" /LENGTH=90 /DNA_ID=CAMNT_0003304425 /DNA_START=94 /DNA_END=367 /DNA_ORIENTATION=+
MTHDVQRVVVAKRKDAIRSMANACVIWGLADTRVQPTDGHLHGIAACTVPAPHLIKAHRPRPDAHTEFRELNPHTAEWIDEDDGADMPYL